MKNFLFSTLLLLGITLMVISCQKENIDLESPSLTENASPNGPVVATVANPDLTITSYTTTVTAMTTKCSRVVIGTPIDHLLVQEITEPIQAGGGQIIIAPIPCPDITCSGQRNFTATVVIKNVGTANLPAGNISVKWVDWGNGDGSNSTQTQAHSGIPVGGTYTMSRSYYMGPCDCLPGGYHKHRFRAIVDPANLIVEVNEANSKSAIYKACHGC